MSMPYYNSINRGMKSHSMRDSMRPMRNFRPFSGDAQAQPLTYDNMSKTRYAPYYGRYYQSNWTLPPNSLNSSLISQATDAEHSFLGSVGEGERVQDGSVVLQISNLDPYYDDHSLRNYLLSQLKPITPVYSLTIEGPNLAKVKVPSQQFAKLVVSHMHRKKCGHKRMIVSYLRDMTSAESSAMRCQVSGLLKDVPFHNLPMCKFRELFQSRFKTSISVLDLYRMPNICSISVDQNEEKFVTLHPDLVNNIDNTPLAGSNQHSVPYCTHHFKQDQNKGWAEIEIDPLPNVRMKLSEVQSIIFSLLKTHDGDIPIASLLYCIDAELGIKLVNDDRGVSLEHLICCVQGVQIKNNSFGIKILAWLEEKDNADDVSVTSSSRYSVKSNNSGGGNHFKFAGSDSLSTISKEVIELIKMCPKSTMKFNKFIPAYHNHFGKQCRVADYGYTKLIELFEALSSIVQLMGDGENREITLNHRTQIRRFTTDLLKVLRCQPTKSLNLSNLPDSYMATFNRCTFDVTDYGVCDVEDLLEGIKHNNSIVVSNNPDGNDVFLFIQKRKQTLLEMEKTCIFAGEVVEMLRKAPQYSVLFRKFVRLYHYHFGYQCKLSEYGFLKLSDLMEAISGVIEIEPNNDENRKLYLSKKVAHRVFSDQVHDIIETSKSGCILKVEDLKQLFKDKYGYQMLPETLGYENFIDCLKNIAFIELSNQNNELLILSHLKDENFRQKAYMACMIIYESGASKMPLQRFTCAFAEKFKFSIDENTLVNMRHAVEIEIVNRMTTVSLNPLINFVIRIIDALKQRRGVGVHELKSILRVHVSTCHDLGFPNISSIILAFPDIFKSLDSSIVHERSTIELNKDCILAKIKKTAVDVKPVAGGRDAQIFNGVKPKFQQPVNNRRHPLTEQNLDLSSLNSTFMTGKPSMSSSFNNSVEYNRNMSDDMLFNQNSMSLFNFNHDQPKMASNRYSSNNTVAIQQQQAMQNLQQQLLNSFQEQSNQIFQKMNFCPQYQMPENSAISLNHSQIIEQQRMTGNRQHKELMNNSVVSNSSCNSSASSFDTNLQTSLPFSVLSAFNEPPKPDTPPSMPIPFWAGDPVWGTHSEPSQPNVECLNINIPELKTYNILPVIMSPFVNLSVNNKTIFTFDNKQVEEKKFQI